MSFDMSKLRRSDQIVGAGAIAFFIFLFIFKWYGGSASASIGGISYGASANGWHSFTNSRYIWIITIIVAVGLVAMRALQQRLELPVQPSVIVAALGALSTLLILYRILHHPSASTSGTVAGVHYAASYGIKIGIWLGLIAAAAVTYGGYLGMGEEGTSLSAVREQASEAFSSFTAPAADTSPTAGAPGTAAAADAPPMVVPPLPPPAAGPGAGGQPPA
jgi:hypothetical protein